MAWIDYKRAYQEDHGNLVIGKDSRRKGLSIGKDIPGRCSITITICDSLYATQPHPKEMHNRLQTQ